MFQTSNRPQGGRQESSEGSRVLHFLSFWLDQTLKIVRLHSKDLGRALKEPGQVWKAGLMCHTWGLARPAADLQGGQRGGHHGWALHQGGLLDSKCGTLILLLILDQVLLEGSGSLNRNKWGVALGGALGVAQTTVQTTVHIDLGSIPRLGKPFLPKYECSLHEQESLKRMWMIGKENTWTHLVHTQTQQSSSILFRELPSMYGIR